MKTRIKVRYNYYFDEYIIADAGYYETLSHKYVEIKIQRLTKMDNDYSLAVSAGAIMIIFLFLASICWVIYEVSRL